MAPLGPRRASGRPLVDSADPPGRPQALPRNGYGRGTRAQESTVDADREDRRQPRRAPRPPSATRLDDLICYFQGTYVPMREAKVSVMTHCVHVRDGDVRGHPRLLERGAAAALRALPSVSTSSASASRAGSSSWSRAAVGRRVPRDRRRDGPPEPFPRGRLHPAVVLQEQPGDRRQAPPPRARPVRHRRPVRRLRRHGERHPDHDVVVAAQRGRGAAGARQDRRRLREHGLPEDARRSSTASTRRSS